MKTFETKFTFPIPLLHPSYNHLPLLSHSYRSNSTELHFPPQFLSPFSLLSAHIYIDIWCPTNSFETLDLAPCVKVWITSGACLSMSWLVFWIFLLQGIFLPGHPVARLEPYPNGTHSSCVMSKRLKIAKSQIVLCGHASLVLQEPFLNPALCALTCALPPAVHAYAPLRFGSYIQVPKLPQISPILHHQEPFKECSTKRKGLALEKNGGKE